MKTKLDGLEEAFLAQALSKISALVEEGDRLKEAANTAWLNASKLVTKNRGVELSSSTLIVVERDEEGVAFFLQEPDAEEEKSEVDQEEPALVE